MIGLGLIGQLVVRLLVASGVQVVGLDTVEARCRARREGRCARLRRPRRRGRGAARQAVLLERTGGLGADHVLLAAGGDSNGPVEIAARLARDRARVVDIGKTKLDLPWNAYYEKELDVRFSRSYGPGRYDDRYELDGVDYPAGYVRWTERRNLACFLDLLADGSARRRVAGLGRLPDRGRRRRLRPSWRTGDLTGVGFLLSYERPGRPPDAAPTARTIATTPAPAPAATAAAGDGALRVGFVGAGNYAASMLLPHLRERRGVELVSVATTTLAVRASTRSASSASRTTVDRRRGRARRPRRSTPSSS